MIRSLYWESTDNSYEAYFNLEHQMWRIAVSTSDFAEGVSAFKERPPARFEGV
jgi:2-(1,2-epoxy-1,2-dihydrophenyl)acetyl-CoA isomerase